MSWVDWLGEPGLDGSNLVGIVPRKLLDDVTDADPVCAESMQDGAVESSESRKIRINVHRVVVAVEAVQGGLNA
jgi:hypothetical protein